MELTVRIKHEEKYLGLTFDEHLCVFMSCMCVLHVYHVYICAHMYVYACIALLRQTVADNIYFLSFNLKIIPQYYVKLIPYILL